MKSILLCEGPDDLWFSGYYLNKKAGWDTCNPEKYWKYYQVGPLNKKQHVEYFFLKDDCVAIWCVGGKNNFQHAIEIVKEKFIENYPNDPIGAIVILRDRDNDNEEDVIDSLQNCFANEIILHNKESSFFTKVIDGISISIPITPIIIPFEETGAIETLLMNSIREKSAEGSIVVDEACKYIGTLVDNPKVGIDYLKHDREILKAKYAAVIAATNPGHSTGLFQDLVLSCPWEDSEYVCEHFECIRKAITSE